MKKKVDSAIKYSKIMKRHVDSLAVGLREVQHRTLIGGLHASSAEEEPDEELNQLEALYGRVRKKKSIPVVDNVMMEESVHDILLCNNNESFLKSLKGNVNKSALNIPIPIASTNEDTDCLKMMKSILEEMSGICFESLEQKQSPDFSEWLIRGCPKLDGELYDWFSFSVSFRVDDCKLGMMKFDVPDPVREEMSDVLKYCESNSCFRTFCTCISQYTRFYLERDLLFQDLTDRFPNFVKIQIRTALITKYIAFKSLVIGGTQAVLVWKPSFSFQQGQVTDDCRGFIIHTKIHLWRNVKTFTLDKGFQKLVKARGISSACAIVLNVLHANMNKKYTIKK